MALMGLRKDMDDIAAAVAKIADNLDALRGWKRPKPRKKHKALAK